MTNPEAESEAVLAFIRERQAEVLSGAITQLSESSIVDLPAVLHKATGSVGSYRLEEAHALLVEFSGVVSDPTATQAGIEEARARTVDALRAAGTGAHG